MSEEYKTNMAELERIASTLRDAFPKCTVTLYEAEVDGNDIIPPLIEVVCPSKAVEKAARDYIEGVENDIPFILDLEWDIYTKQ